MWKWIMTILIILILGIMAGKMLSKIIIRMEHPCPTLTKEFPILKRIDKYLMLTASIEWYKCIEKSTGKEYIVNINYSDKYGERIYLYNDETRTKQYVTREEYMNNYTEPVMGHSFDWNDSKIKEVLKYKDGK